jgi:hypothetical protein
MNEQQQQAEQQITDLENEALEIEDREEKKEKFTAQEQEVYDEAGEKIKLIPYPSYSEAKSVGTLLPINMANEIVTNLSLLSRQFDFIDFIKEKLGYATRLKVLQSFASEQIDALVLAIKSFEKGNAFILGDMAGTGKGRVCAGVMRYAYMQGFVPVFLSQKSYLFNDIYRDIVNIGGIGYKNNKYIDAKPFIMHNQGAITNRKTGLIIPTEQAYTERIKNNVITYSLKDNGKANSINELCDKMTNNIQRTGKIQLHKDFNCVMLPYSVLSHGRSKSRIGFINEIAPNALFVFDESHNAASADSKSNILNRALPIVENSKACLFSSATYAKTPRVFNLYVVKTALRTAVPSLESISDALKVGGENVSEYIATGLAKEGQMVRRMRSFGDCKKVTEYVGQEIEEDGDIVRYKDLPDDNQRKIFNEAIGYFKELRDFSKSNVADEAIRNAIQREIDSMGIRVADTKEYLSALRSNKKDDTERQKFISENKNKYVLTYTKDSISRYKATFRENLFLALKAKFAADKIIECLNTPVRYKNNDGTEQFTPQKPIIAMANTGEAIFNELRLTDNQAIENDFAQYLLAIYNRLFIGNFTLRKVDKNIFESPSTLDNDGIDYDIIEGEYFVDYSDFADGGQRIMEIQNRLQSYTSELPFSVIDYLRERIESTPRSDVYFENGKVLYGRAGSPFYKFVEGTARKYMLKRDDDGVLRFMKNDRIKSTTTVFRAFNDGDVDVMLINVVASTGGSAQSSPEEGIDTRQRNMFIVQFELDINIEVQKRGRINRTGQLNSPTYTYIISRIPVELRKYLMFRKKLRKLDANVSADQTSTSKEAEITDNKGKPIEDIFNHYGYEVFKNDFINQPENIKYFEIFENLHWRSKEVEANATAENNEINVEHFDTFVRELELYPAEFQEVFFNQMNEKYISKKEELIARNEFQEELSAQNYLASLKQKVVVQLNSGTTVFSLPLFLTDYYTLESKKPLSKDALNKKANELAVWDGQQMTPEQFHQKLLIDISDDYYTSVNDFIAEYEQGRPIETDYADAQEYLDDVAKFELNKQTRLFNFKKNNDEIKFYVSYFAPFKPVYYAGLLGQFVGYKILNTGTKFKYTKGNIEFVFCFLSGIPQMRTKLTTHEGDGIPILQVIRDYTNLFIYPSATAGNMSDMFVAQSVRDRQKIADWKPEMNRRIVRRFLSGNILSGIVEAYNKKFKNEIKSWALTRFTNIDGTISTAIELKYDIELSAKSMIETNSESLSVSAGNKNIHDYLQDIPPSTSYGYSYADLRDGKLFPIWNVETENLIDRAICALKRQDNINKPVIQFHILQTVISTKDKQTGRNLIKERKEGGDLYNYMYYDKELDAMFNDNLITKTKPPLEQQIGYGYYRVKKKSESSSKKEFSEKFYSVKGYIKIFEFPLSQKDKITEFLMELHNRYDLSFNFRSDVASFYNIEAQQDIFDKSKKAIVTAFPKGRYEYRFNKSVSDDVKAAIPDVIEFTENSVYGGVALPFPMQPSRLRSYELKPYKISPDILVKLTFSELTEEEKKSFVQELEKRAEVDNEDAYEIGRYVRDYLSEKTVGTTYFFGDLQLPEYGKIFRDYALKEDIRKLLFEEKEKEEVELEMEKTKEKIGSFEDAENFVFSIYEQI